MRENNLILTTPRLEIVALTESELKLWIEDLPRLELKLNCRYRAEKMEGIFLDIVKSQYEITKSDPQNYIWHSFFFIIRKSDRVVVGAIDFKDIPNINGEVEIGYGLGEEFENNGYMRETVKELCNWALNQNEKPIAHVIAETDADGYKSHNVLKNCGFKLISKSDVNTFWWSL